MSYNDRIIIKQHFMLNNLKRVNSIKLIEYDDFVQLYLNNGDHHASTRLDGEAIRQLKEYLDKVEIRS